MAGKSVMLMAAIVVIGGGVFAFNAMQKPEVQITDDVVQAQSEKTITENPAAGFLNYDIIVGNKDAPIEIIEYAAITCPHCADFHVNVLPLLKKKYLDTGKARLVYRNFIFDNPFDVFAAAMTRCGTEAEFFPTLETYFENQKDWNKLSELKRIFEANGKEAAIKFAKGEVARVGLKAGISTDDARKCFDNKEVVNYLLEVRRVASETYQVNSTPTLIVDGRKLDHNDIASIEKAIEDTAR